MTASPLFGRDAETSWIDNALDRICTGSEAVGAAAFVVGPPGIGKTRLVEHAAAAARRRGLVVAIGRAWETGGAPAGWPLVEALRVWRGDPALAAACDALGPARAHLAPLHPELAAADPRPKHDERDASARFLVFDAVTELWRGLSRVRPCLLVLEDLHAADPFTAELLAMLCQRAGEMPLFVLGTYRAREARLSEHAAEAIARASRSAHVIELQPLGREDAERVARHALGDRASPEQVERVVAASDGNPLFVTELARTADRSTPGRTPGGLNHAIAAHVRTLGPVAREVAGLASIFGRRVDPAILRRTCRDALELDDLAIGAALHELAERELVVGDDEGRLGFVHILVRDALYEELPPGRREALHASAVIHLEHAGAPGSQLAHHALEAGAALAPSRTIGLTRRAVAEALGALAFEDAAVLLTRLADLVEGLACLEPEEVLSLRLEQAQAEMSAGRVTAGRETSARVAAAARALGHPELLARAALAYGAEFTRGHLNKRMVRLLEEALELLGNAVTPLRVRVLGRYATALFPARDPEVPVAVAEKAIDLARQLGDRRVLADALFYARIPLVFWYPAQELLPLEREALAVTREVGSPVELARALTMAAVAHMLAREPRAAEALIGEALALAEGTQSPQQVFRLHLVDAMLALHRGEFDRADRIYARARACTERGPVEASVPVFLLTRFCAARLRRDREALVAMRTELTTLLDSMPNAAAILAGYYAFLGEAEAARAELAKRDNDLRGRPVAGLVSMAEAAIFVSDLELARELYDRILPFADDIVAWGMMGFTAEGVGHGWLARLSEALGRPHDADRHFARAAELDEATGGLPSLANVLEDWGDALAMRGGAEDREKAAGLFRRAAALAAELGLHARARPLEARASDLPAARAGSPGPQSPRAPQTAAMLEVRRDGDLVVVTFGSERFTVRDSKGMRYLEVLVRVPGSDVHALELVGADAGPEVRAAFGNDAGPLLDAKAKAAYRERVRELREELAEAEDFSDLARAEALRDELESVLGELARATGLGGRDRSAVSPAERARVNVQRRLKAAVSTLAKHSRALDEHLARALRTGTFCRYDPPLTP